MISLSIAGNLPLKKMINIGASLRYGKFATWILIILPLIYSRIRLPTYAVLVYSISVVDMSLLLAPSLPPPLAVIVINGFNNGDMSNLLPASVGATLQIGLALLAVAIWMIVR